MVSYHEIVGLRLDSDTREPRSHDLTSTRNEDPWFGTMSHRTRPSLIGDVERQDLQIGHDMVLSFGRTPGGLVSKKGSRYGHNTGRGGPSLGVDIVSGNPGSRTPHGVSSSGVQSPSCRK